MNKNKIDNITSLQLILDCLSRKDTFRKGVLNPVSSITTDQMDIMGSYFPEAHTDAKKMYELSRANYELLDYDGIMPVFSVVIDAYGLGCKVDWGKIDMMPRVLGKLWKGYKDISIDYLGIFHSPPINNRRSIVGRKCSVVEI